MPHNGDDTNDRELAVELAELVPQPHGGALLSGGLPGHRGGSGRLPSALRRAMRQSLESRLSIAEQIADDETASASDRLRALDFMAKYGLGTTNTETDTEGNDRVGKVIEVPAKLDLATWVAKGAAMRAERRDS